MIFLSDHIDLRLMKIQALVFNKDAEIVIEGLSFLDCVFLVLHIFH